MPGESFHFGVEAFGDAVVAREAPHDGDLGGPGMHGFAESDQRSEGAVFECLDRTEEAWCQVAAP